MCSVVDMPALVLMCKLNNGVNSHHVMMVLPMQNNCNKLQVSCNSVHNCSRNLLEHEQKTTLHYFCMQISS